MTKRRKLEKQPQKLKREKQPSAQPLFELKARRFISQTRADRETWANLRRVDTGYLSYDPITNAYTHFVIVSDQDERVDTYRLFEPEMLFNPDSL